MKENVMLLQEINVLRKDVHELRLKLKLISFIDNGQGMGGNELSSTQRSKQMDLSMRDKEPDI